MVLFNKMASRFTCQFLLIWKKKKEDKMNKKISLLNLQKVICLYSIVIVFIWEDVLAFFFNNLSVSHDYWRYILLQVFRVGEFGLLVFVYKASSLVFLVLIVTI